MLLDKHFKGFKILYANKTGLARSRKGKHPHTGNVAIKIFEKADKRGSIYARNSIFYSLLDFFMEANNMNRDQIAPLLQKKLQKNISR